MKKEEIKENNNIHVGAGSVSAQETQNRLHTNQQNYNENVGVAWHATQNAITLISLIITIIILLILAGVSLNLIIGENGMFRLAQNAGKNYMDAQEKEENILANYENKIVGYLNGTRENSKINYSLEEQSTGITWIDGKTIYQKTIICEYPSGINSEKLYNLSDLNIDNVVTMNAITHYKTSFHALPYFYTRSDGILTASEEMIIFNDIDGTKKLRIRTVKEDFTGTYAYVTIQYTKN